MGEKIKNDPNHWTKNVPQIATKEHCSIPWNGGKNGKYFRCYLCGHKFVPGDNWRFIYGKNVCRNIFVCRECDGPDEELRQKFADIEKKYSWIWIDTYYCDHRQGE
jgi:hypothetical protein